LVNLKLIDPDSDVMLIADTGIVIRTRVKDISKISRDTMGVRIMKFTTEGKVVGVSASPAAADDVEEDE
jgi:DNA gyrase subunit A